MTYRQPIMDFELWCNQTYVSLEKQVKALQIDQANWDVSHKSYKQIYLSLQGFEDMCVDFYSDGDRTKRVLSNPSAEDLPMTIAENVDKWENPFKPMWLAMRKELLDIKSM